MFDLTEFSSDEILLVEQVIGQGEVMGVVALPDGIGAQIAESVMAGLWRVRFTDASDKLVADYLEVSSLPEIARRAALNNCLPLTPGKAPAGAMNVMPLLTEIASRAAKHEPGDPTHAITFSLLPMSPADMSHLQQRLGPGAVRLVSKGYGSCRILSTATKNVWSVQFFNAMGEDHSRHAGNRRRASGGLRGGRGFSRQRPAPARDRGGLFRMSGFENFGKKPNVEDDAKMECGVCWHVYDPAEGDSVWQIPPGTPFSALPEDWRCPNCDAAQERFMRLRDHG